MLQFKALSKSILRTTGIVAPMTLSHLRGRINLEIHDTLEGLGFEMYMTIVVDIKLEVDTLIDGKACHQSMLVVHMRSQWAHTVR